MDMNASLRAALLLALLPLVCACTRQSPAQDAMRAAQATQRALEKLPPECTLGRPGLAAHGSWLTTAKAVPGPGTDLANVFSFDKVVTTRALRVALDLHALRTIEKMETRDAQGNWKDAGALRRLEAPAVCEYVWLEQELPETRQTDALRFTFRRESGTITVASAGVLQDAAH
jgi:hypothetical protein